MRPVVRRKRTVSAVCTLLAGSALAACSSTSGAGGASVSDGKVKVIFVCGTPAAGAYYAPLEQGAKDAAREVGVSLDYTGLGSTDATPAAMSRLLQDAINQHPSALVVCDYFGGAENPLIQKATAAGIPVFNSDGGYADASKAGVVAQVGQEDAAAGQQAGEKMIAAGVTHPLCVNHSPANPSTVARCTGFSDAFRAKGISTKILNLTEGDLANTTAQQSAIKGALAADQKIDGVLVLGPESGVAAVGAVAQSGRASQVKVGTFDTSTEILNDIKQGSLMFAIWQQPYLHGYLPVVFAAAYVRHHGVSPTGFVSTGPVFITKDNISRIEAAASAGVA